MKTYKFDTSILDKIFSAKKLKPIKYQQQLIKIVRRAINILPKHQRYVIRQRLKGTAFKQINKKKKWHKGTASVFMFRAKKKLYTILQNMPEFLMWVQKRDEAQGRTAP